MIATVLLNGVAANGAPLGNVAGTLLRGLGSTGGFGIMEYDEAELVIEDVAGTAAGTISYCRIWGLFHTGVTQVWCPLGSGNSADKGKINGGGSLGVVSANRLSHAERVRGLAECERIYLELGVVGGGASITATLVVRS